MKFTTTVEINEQPDYLNHKSEILSVGSCFSENIGTKLKKSGFDIMINPYGIVFHPLALATNLNFSIGANRTDTYLLERDGMFYDYFLHSKLRARTKEKLTTVSHGIDQQVREKLGNCDLLILTFGTAWGYKLNSDGKIVANCHKMPQCLFEKELTDLENLKRVYDELLSTLKVTNTKLKILLTVSPVKHSKNGLHGNNLSKSTLLLLCSYLSKKFDFVNYFPSYEIVVDELRDYRFYKQDLIHPTEQAVDYIFLKFQSAFFSASTLELTERYNQLERLSQHKMLNPSVENEEKIKQKIQGIQQEIQALKVKH